MEQLRVWALVLAAWVSFAKGGAGTGQHDDGGSGDGDEASSGSSGSSSYYSTSSGSTTPAEDLLWTQAPQGSQRASELAPPRQEPRQAPAMPPASKEPDKQGGGAEATKLEEPEPPAKKMPVRRMLTDEERAEAQERARSRGRAISNMAALARKLDEAKKTLANQAAKSPFDKAEESKEEVIQGTTNAGMASSSTGAPPQASTAAASGAIDGPPTTAAAADCDPEGTAQCGAEGLKADEPVEGRTTVDGRNDEDHDEPKEHRPSAIEASEAEGQHTKSGYEPGLLPHKAKESTITEDKKPLHKKKKHRQHKRDRHETGSNQGPVEPGDKKAARGRKRARQDEHVQGGGPTSPPADGRSKTGLCDLTRPAQSSRLQERICNVAGSGEATRQDEPEEVRGGSATKPEAQKPKRQEDFNETLATLWGRFGSDTTLSILQRQVLEHILSQAQAGQQMAAMLRPSPQLEDESQNEGAEGNPKAPWKSSAWEGRSWKASTASGSKPTEAEEPPRHHLQAVALLRHRQFQKSKKLGHDMGWIQAKSWIQGKEVAFLDLFEVLADVGIMAYNRNAVWSFLEAAMFPSDKTHRFELCVYSHDGGWTVYMAAYAKREERFDHGADPTTINRFSIYGVLEDGSGFDMDPASWLKSMYNHHHDVDKAMAWCGYKHNMQPALDMVAEDDEVPEAAEGATAKEGSAQDQWNTAGSGSGGSWQQQGHPKAAVQAQPKKEKEKDQRQHKHKKHGKMAKDKKTKARKDGKSTKDRKYKKIQKKVSTSGGSEETSSS